MDKKTTILLDTAGFLAAVHNYKKSEIADLIIALCEFNLYGCTSIKLTDMKKVHFDAIQEVIELRNSRWLKTCEINAQNAKKRTANRKATAERNSSEPPEPAQTDRPEDKERDKENDSELDKEKESESDFINKKDKDKNTQTPVIVERIVNDIDDIVKIVRFPDWQDTTAGTQEIKKALRSIIWIKYKIKDKDVFDKAYKYIEQYY